MTAIVILRLIEHVLPDKLLQANSRAVPEPIPPFDYRVLEARAPLT
jgi:hypothetical protein